jgi:hypothetical protein
VNMPTRIQRIKEVIEWAVSEPGISDEDKASIRSMEPSRSIAHRIRRAVFDELNNSLDVRIRVRAASRAGWCGAAVYPLARDGITVRTVNQGMRNVAKHRNSARECVLSSARTLIAAGEQLDQLTPTRREFSLALELVAQEHGLTCHDGRLAERLLRTLAGVASVFGEPLPVPEPIVTNPGKAESLFDVAIAKAIGEALPSVRAKSRLIFKLRGLLGLPRPPTPGAIEQRISDLVAR